MIRNIVLSVLLMALYVMMLISVYRVVVFVPSAMATGWALVAFMAAFGIFEVLSDRDYRAWVWQLCNPGAFYTTSDPRPFNHL